MRTTIAIVALALVGGLVVVTGRVEAAPPVPVNVAEGRVADQSSTFQGAEAYDAVDGNNHGVFGHGSVSHTRRDDQAWWEVDLGRSYELTEIVIWNRTDCCGERLADFHVFVSDQPFAGPGLADAQGTPGVADIPVAGPAGEETHVPVGRSGRYVRVQLAGTDYLHLAEVEVFSLLDQQGQPGGAGLDVDVFVNGSPAFSAPGPEVAAGDPVLLTYEIFNSGSEQVWALFVWQGGVGAVDCPTRTLRPGEKAVCEATAAASADFSRDVDVEAWTGDGGRVEDAATVHYSVSGATGDSGLVNLALGADATQSGTTSGHAARLAVDGNRDGDAGAGSVSMTHRIVEAYWQVDLGRVHDIDEIVLWNRTDCCSDRLRDFHVLVSDTPFEFEDLQYSMTQDGVLDVHHMEVAGRRTDIPVGRTGRYIRIQAEYRDAMVQLAEVEVMGPAAGGGGVVTPVAATDLSIDVTVNGQHADLAPGPTFSPGGPVTFEYTITNTGTRRLWALYVWDDVHRTVECPARSMGPGERIVCTVEAAAIAGRYGSRIEASAWDEVGVEAYDTDAVYYTGTDGGSVVGPALGIEAFVEGSDADELPGPDFDPGEQLSFTYEVTNTGSEKVWSLIVWHDGVGAAACPEDSLAPGASVTCTGSGLAGAGEVVASVFADAWDRNGTRASDADPIAYTGRIDTDGASLVIESYVNGEDGDDPPGATVIAGAEATWTFQVENIGTEKLYGLWVYDRELGAVSCPTSTLAVGARVTCEVARVPSAGLRNSTVEATAWDGDGVQASDSDRHHYFVAEAGAAVDLEVLVDGLDGWWDYGPRIREGEIVTFDFIVSNTGTEPIDGITVTDDRFGAVPCAQSSLRPGESLTCSVTERARLGRVVTYGHVRGQSPDGPVADDERAAYHVKVTGRNDQISLEVTVDGRDASTEPGPRYAVGQTVELRYVVTNLGTWATIYDVEVNDPRVPDAAMSCTDGTSVYLGSMVCTATVTVQAGQYSAVVLAQAWSSNGPKMQATAVVHFYGIV